MNPWYAKLLATALAGALVIAAQYFPGVAAVLYMLAGVPVGKELFPRTGDAILSSGSDK